MSAEDLGIWPTIVEIEGLWGRIKESVMNRGII